MWTWPARPGVNFAADRGAPERWLGSQSCDTARGKGTERNKVHYEKPRIIRRAVNVTTGQKGQGKGPKAGGGIGGKPGG